MIRKYVMIAILLIPSFAHAQRREERPIAPLACVRIRQVYVTKTSNGQTVNTQTQTSVSTGTVIHNDGNGRGLVLTCAHGIDERGPVQLLISHSDLAWGKITAI